jgi:signal transduction histidine kinase
MRYTLYLALQIVAVAALVVTIVLGLQWWSIALAVLVVIVAFALAYKSVAVPLHTVQNGLYLLQEQDFSSRLRLVGQTDADKVARLFNSLMDTLKAERLHNREQNTFLNKLIDASPMGIAMCDFDAHITNANRAFKQMCSDDLMAVLGSLDEGESRVWRAAQSQILRCTRSFFMEEGFKRPFFLVERLTDEILRAETDMFSKVVRTMGHEVNNTLGSVTSVLQTMQDMHAADDFVVTTLQSSIDSCNNLGKFVKGYADVVKLPEAALVRTDLNSVVTRALPVLRHLAADNITVVTRLCEQPVPVNLDEALFERVLVNIVKNSVDSIADSPGEITIATAPGTLSITDNGSGITAENAQKLFTPFFSTKRNDRGLGLMLIADILRKHHAEFALATNQETQLTTFTITFAR